MNLSCLLCWQLTVACEHRRRLTWMVLVAMALNSRAALRSFARLLCQDEYPETKDKAIALFHLYAFHGQDLQPVFHIVATQQCLQPVSSKVLNLLVFLICIYCLDGTACMRDAPGWACLSSFNLTCDIYIYMYLEGKSKTVCRSNTSSYCWCFPDLYDRRDP